ncbi:MAG: SLBB domain-containing protein [Geovibrio sp.]|nr:SLBB domain-containing protein [Geovibrio sp.]
MKKGLRLSDILSNRDMLKRNTALEYGYIERYTGEGKTKQIIGFNLGEVLKTPQNHGNNVEVQPMDVINILTAEQVKAQNFVSVSGEVNAAGKYKMPEIANVMDAIMKAGGFAVDASMENIEVVRKIGGKFYTRFIDAEAARKLELNADDSVVVHSKYADSPKRLYRGGRRGQQLRLLPPERKPHGERTHKESRRTEKRSIQRHCPSLPH